MVLFAFVLFFYSYIGKKVAKRQYRYMFGLSERSVAKKTVFALTKVFIGRHFVLITSWNGFIILSNKLNFTSSKQLFQTISIRIYYVLYVRVEWVEHALKRLTVSQVVLVHFFTHTHTHKLITGWLLFEKMVLVGKTEPMSAPVWICTTNQSIIWSLWSYW